MRLLVTGGAGFIGANFIHYILKKYPDYKVVNLDNLTYAGNLENLKGVENNPNYRFVKGDICDVELVNELVEDCDAIVHFAAESHVDRSILDPGIFVKTNVLGTITLLNAARNNGNKRFHHISTDEVWHYQIYPPVKLLLSTYYSILQQIKSYHVLIKNRRRAGRVRGATSQID